MSGRASLGSSPQIGSSSGGDWKEEAYQKIKSMNEMYFHDLNELYQRMAPKVKQHDVVPQQPKNEQLEKLIYCVALMERLIVFLRTNKNEVKIYYKDIIDLKEKQIINILNSSRLGKLVSDADHIVEEYLETRARRYPRVVGQSSKTHKF